jgi:2-hydroxy-3-oxopropionate reductase
MAMRLLDSGYQVFLPVISHGKAASEALVAQGAEWFSCTDVDAYCFCLPRSEDVAECIERFSPMRSIEMFDFSTGDPRKARELVSRASESGSLYFDCPVSGSAIQAAAGALTMWIGSTKGDATPLCCELVDKLAARPFWMGGHGRGFSAKLVNQVIHILNVAAIGEGLKIAEVQGLPRELIIESLMSASAASTMLDRFGLAIAARDHSAQFRLELAAKDIDYAVGVLSAQQREHLPYLKALRQNIDEAMSRGLHDQNFTCFVDNGEGSAS